MPMPALSVCLCPRHFSAAEDSLQPIDMLRKTSCSHPYSTTNWELMSNFSATSALRWNDSVDTKFSFRGASEDQRRTYHENLPCCSYFPSFPRVLPLFFRNYIPKNCLEAQPLSLVLLYFLLNQIKYNYLTTPPRHFLSIILYFSFI